MENQHNLTERIELVREIRAGNVQLTHEGNYWSEEERKRLAEEFREGTGITDISLMLQRTEIAIMQQIAKMGLTIPKNTHYRKRGGCQCPSCAIKESCKKWNTAIDQQKEVFQDA